MVEVYSKTVCPQCRMVKKFLDDKGIPYVEHNVEKDTDALEYLQQAGISHVPVTKVPNGKMIMGFNVNELRELA